MNFPTSEFLQISKVLEDHYSIFSLIWKIGKPQFSETITTKAAMRIVGKEIYFLFRPDVWKILTFEQKKFIICHELLHIFLNHHLRLKQYTIKNKEKNALHAMDLVINQMLIEHFGFNRWEVDPNNEACWMDNLFDSSVARNRSFEYYADLLEKMKINYESFDSHDFNQTFSSIVGQVLTSISEEEGKRFFSVIGNESLYRTFKIEKKKFEWPKEFLNSMKKSFIQKNKSNKMIDSWTHKNRRLFSISNDLFLPSPIKKETDKSTVFIFLDSSASCYSKLEEFANLAWTIPSDKFDAKLYSFASTINPIQKQSDCTKIVSEVTTSFSIIEEFLLKQKQYPDLTVVFTDGWGNEVCPKYPERWNWMLSLDKRKYIPKESSVYLL